MNNVTNEKISKLILGSAQLGTPYGIVNKLGKPNKEEALKIIRYAFSNGIDTIDTAPSYGDSESIIGEFVNEQKKIQGKWPTIITKIPPVTLSSSSSTACITSFIEKKVSNSLTKLNVDTLDCCLLHNPEDMNSYNGDVVASLIKLKQAGIINKLGVSLYTPEEVKKAISLRCFDIIQVPINIFDHRLIHSGLLKELSKCNIEIYARSIYLQGLIFMNPNELPSNLQSAKEYLENLRELSRMTGFSLAELSMLFIREIPEIKKIVIGCESINQLKNNLTIMTTPKLMDDIMNQIWLLFHSVPEIIINPTMWNR